MMIMQSDGTMSHVNSKLSFMGKMAFVSSGYD